MNARNENTRVAAVAEYRATRFEILAESLRIAANERDGFRYDAAALAAAGSAPAGIIGR